MTFDPQTQLRLIAGILAEPGEDAPRLVYADWLEDHGDPLADLIRLHLEMSHPWLSRARLHRLHQRERELYAGLGSERSLSSEELASAVSLGNVPAGWCYGIVDGVPLVWITPGNEGLQLPPREWVTRFGWFTARVCFYDSWKYQYEVNEQRLRQLLEWPMMDHCIGLDMALVRKWYGDCTERLVEWSGASRLLRLGWFDGSVFSPRFAGLVSVELETAWRCDAEYVAALATMPDLRRVRLSRMSLNLEIVAALAKLSGLRSLELPGSHDFNDPEALTLAQGTLHNLIELNLAQTKVADDGALALIRSPNLPCLRRLNLAGTNVSARTIEELCATDRFLRAGDLPLHGCENTVGTIEAVARSPHAAHLRSLSVSEVQPNAALEIAASPHLKGLVKLLLHGEIGPEGAETLTSESLPYLEELVLRSQSLGDRGALALARFGHTKGDPLLDLSRMGVTAAGIAELIASGCCRGLRELWLDENPIGDAGITALASCCDLKDLRELWLFDVGMTDEGARVLVESKHLPRELWLTWHGNTISQEMGAAIRERFRRS